MVEEATAAAANLKSEAAELSRLVGQFRTGAAAPTRRLELVQQDRHAPARNPVAQAQNRLKAFAGAAPAKAEGWEEF
jgi:methyl-accepting chemotaxis protein